jgi:murein L,D-transpeptidase YcbB/YkuD
MQLRRLIPLIFAGTTLATATALVAYERRPNDFPLNSTLTAADQDLARALRKILFDRRGPPVIEGVQTRAAVGEFYKNRGFAPLWVANGKPSARFVRARDYLATIDREGLEPQDYAFPDLAGDPTSLAMRELAVTRTLLRYAQDANGGRVSFSRLSPNISYPPKSVDAVSVLSQVSDAENVQTALQSFHPAHPHYLALKRALSERRADPTVAPEQVDRVIANLERWRWLPHELASSHVVVNIPDYTLRLVHDGEIVFLGSVIVGKPSTPTPLIAATMNSLTFNPIWNVPASIAQSEAMLAFAWDSGQRQQAGLTLTTGDDGRPRMSQSPGGTNPLGRVRFNLPNPFAVYQHDTPDNFLFEQTMRAFSHGCVRVDNALDYAAAILSMQPGGKGAAPKVSALLQADNADVALAAPLPVHFTYETMTRDNDGGWQAAPDIYNYDQPLLALLQSRRIRQDRVPASAGAASQARRSLGGFVQEAAHRVRAGVKALVPLSGWM